MTHAARPTVEAIRKDIAAFDGKDKGEGLSHIIDEISELRKSDPRHFQDNLRRLSEDNSLTKLGFPTGYTLLGMEGGKLSAANTSEKGNGEIVKLDARTGKIEAPVNNKLTDQEMGKNGRKYQVDEAGGAYYKVGDKGAENIWNIARDYAAGKNNGQKPSNAEILASVKELQDFNKIKNINLIHPGDMIKLPPSFNTKQWQGPVMPETEPFKATPAEAQKVLDQGKADNIIGTEQVDRPLADQSVEDLIKASATPGVDQGKVKEIAAAGIEKGATDIDNMTKAWAALQNASPEQKAWMQENGLLGRDGKPDMTTSVFMGVMADLASDKGFAGDPKNKDFVDSLNYIKANWGLKFKVGGNTHVDQAYFDRLMDEMRSNSAMLAAVRDR